MTVQQRTNWYVSGGWHWLSRVEHYPGNSLFYDGEPGHRGEYIRTRKIVCFDDLTIANVALKVEAGSGTPTVDARFQIGIWDIDPSSGLAVGAPLGQTGEVTPTVGVMTVPFLEPLALSAGVYRVGFVNVGGFYLRTSGVTFDNRTTDEGNLNAFGSSTRFDEGWGFAGFTTTLTDDHGNEYTVVQDYTYDPGGLPTLPAKTIGAPHLFVSEEFDTAAQWPLYPQFLPLMKFQLA